MNKKFFIVIGRSGSGKGTQSEILKSELEKRGCEDVKHLTTGGGFREFSERDNHSARITKRIIESGNTGPQFVAIWVWSNIFIDTLSENTTVILDGAPRILSEAEILSSAIKFYGYDKPTVVYIDVSETWALDRLAGRGRNDDSTDEDRERKMRWFFEDVLPCVAYYKESPLYDFVHINGEQSVEDVSREMFEKLNPIL